MTKTIKAYKGFDKDLKCRGFQYELGKEYEEPKAEACHCGFHACEHPLDVFGYYAPNDSRYCEVEQSGEIDKSESDKICSTKIKIGAELSLKDIVAAAIKFTFEKTTPENTEHATGDCGASSATGDYGASSATGCKGASSATGDCGASSATGCKGASSATGCKGASSATGNYGASSAPGNCGASSATGDCGASSATGNCGASSATGNYGASSATGLNSIALAAGYKCKAKGAIGSWLCIAERDEWDGKTFPIKEVRAVKVDGENIKPDTWYMLINGEITEVKE